MAYKFYVRPHQPCVHAPETGCPRDFICDAEADLPASGLNPGDEAYAVAEGSKWIAFDATTWVRINLAGTVPTRYADEASLPASGNDPGDLAWAIAEETLWVADATTTDWRQVWPAIVDELSRVESDDAAFSTSSGSLSFDDSAATVTLAGFPGGLVQVRAVANSVYDGVTGITDGVIRVKVDDGSTPIYSVNSIGANAAASIFAINACVVVWDLILAAGDYDITIQGAIYAGYVGTAYFDALHLSVVYKVY